MRLSVLLLLLLARRSRSAVSVGSVGVEHDSEHQLIGKFCFDQQTNNGTAGTISGWVSTLQEKVVLALYDDEHYQEWPTWKRPSGCDCRCKLRHSKTIVPIEPELPEELKVDTTIRLE